MKTDKIWYAWTYLCVYVFFGSICGIVSHMEDYSELKEQGVAIEANAREAQCPKRTKEMDPWELVDKCIDSSASPLVHLQEMNALREVLGADLTDSRLRLIDDFLVQVRADQTGERIESARAEASALTGNHPLNWFFVGAIAGPLMAFCVPIALALLNVAFQIGMVSIKEAYRHWLGDTEGQAIGDGNE